MARPQKTFVYKLRYEGLRCNGCSGESVAISFQEGVAHDWTEPNTENPEPWANVSTFTSKVPGVNVSANTINEY